MVDYLLKPNHIRILQGYYKSAKVSDTQATLLIEFIVQWHLNLWQANKSKESVLSCQFYCGHKRSADPKSRQTIKWHTLLETVDSGHRLCKEC